MQMDEVKKFCHKVNAEEVLINDIERNGDIISASIKERMKHWYYSEKKPLIYYTECSRELGLLVSHVILNVDFSEKFVIEKLCIYNYTNEKNLDKVNEAKASITSREINKDYKAKNATIKVDLYDLNEIIATVLIKFIYVSSGAYKRIRGKNILENKNRRLQCAEKSIVIGDDFVNPSFKDHYQDHIPAMIMLELLINEISNDKPDKINSVKMEFKKFVEKNTEINFRKKLAEEVNTQNYDVMQNENVCVEVSVNCNYTSYK